MKGRKHKDVLVRSVSLIWYPLTLLPIVALFLAVASGHLPQLLALVALFLFFSGCRHWASPSMRS